MAKTPTLARHVRILDAALDIDPDDKDKIILRGRIDPYTLDAIMFDTYQREVLPVSKINDIMKAFEPGGSIPDVELGMRGWKEKSDETSFVLLDPTYGIDGQQRITAAKRFMAIHAGTDKKLPRIGATIHFNTTYEWEKERFKILNAFRTKVSPNVLIRNEKNTYPALKMVYSLCEDKSFVLHNRVCWAQYKQRMHLLTAVTLIKNVCQLHSHIVPGRGNSSDMLLPALQRVHDKIGVRALRENVKQLYEVIDTCWGIKTVTYDSAVHLRGTFLKALTAMLSDHAAFWRGDKLFVSMPLLRKLKMFPTADPTISQLAGGAGKAVNLLYQLMIEHMNKGKTTKRLVPRKATLLAVEDESDDDAKPQKKGA